MTKWTDTLLTAIEEELKKSIARLDEPQTAEYHRMLSYHMGWSGEGAGGKARGKRIRPLLLLLSTAATGGNWKKALPAAAAVELIHNFSLLHDDIQDKSTTRRGRPTVWVKWGIAQAINAGDGLFIAANLSLAELGDYFSAEIVLQAARSLQKTCLDLTRGQHLDIAYENRSEIALGDYWRMVGWKTSALLSSATEIGALLGNADERTQAEYRNFGHYLGLAFQVKDDILGIWGNEAQTGKSAASDLLEEKKSLPVLYGLAYGKKFAARWRQGNLRKEEISEMARLLEVEGARLQAQEQVDLMTDLALKSLRMAAPKGEAGDALFSLTEGLVGRAA